MKDSFTLLLTFVFVIVIYMVIGKNMRSDMIVGTIALVFTILWISWDNLGAWDNSPLTAKLNDLFGGDTEREIKKKEIKKKLKFAEKDEIIQDYDSDYDSDSDSESDELSKKILEALVDSKEENEKPPSKNSDVIPDNEPKKKLLPDSDRPKSLVYSEENYKKNNLPELGCLGDNGIMRQMKHMSNKNRQSMDGAARFDKYTNIGYFADELKEASSSRGWWDDDVALEREF